MARKAGVKYQGIHATEKTHKELKKISDKTHIPITYLIEEAIPLLKEKYGIKE